MKICIVTGGSGGHIYPAITFADAIAQETDEVFFIGNDYKMESWIVPEAGYRFLGIHNAGLQGSTLDKVKAVFSQFKAIRDSKKLLKKEKPDVVVVFGGYVSAPVAYAASKLRIPLIIHEQNAFPGKANKMVAKKAQAIITCYEEAFKGLDNVYMLGNPRASLIHETIDSNKTLDELGLDKKKPIVLMVMGSQGSTSMNKHFLDFVNSNSLDDIQVVVVPGPLNVEAFKQGIKQNKENIKVVGFVNQKALLPVLDLIVCRSGASTIAEIQSFGIPSILIPSPHVANNHQYYNAKALSDKNAAVLLKEEDILKDTLQTQIEAILSNQSQRETMSKNVKGMATPNAVHDIVDLVLKVINHGR